MLHVEGQGHASLTQPMARECKNDVGKSGQQVVSFVGIDVEAIHPVFPI